MKGRSARRDGLRRRREERRVKRQMVGQDSRFGYSQGRDGVGIGSGWSVFIDGIEGDRTEVAG